MFHAVRWADAFLAVSGKDADDAFSCLKALVPPIKSISGILSGYSAAVRLEKILREGAEAGNLGSPPAMEYAIRFICLLVEKRCFKYIDSLLPKIETALDEQKGFLNFTIEAAAPLDSVFEEELAQMIKEKTGAAGVKVKTRVKPELLAGYMLRSGDFYVDASLRGQLEKMTADLVSEGV